jgi:uncharacterized Zn-binding protein involved in type VI secretion
MSFAARMGDSCAHGGMIVVGCPTVLIENMPAARVGDMHVCPMATPGTPPIPHVGGPIMPPGSPTVFIGGMPAARMGDMATCVGPPDSIIKGSPTVMIGMAGAGSGSGGGAGSSGAAAAKASAKNAVAGSPDTTTKEKNWLEYKLVDKAGNPVSGVDYKLTDTDKKESSGKVKTDGRITRDALKEGNAELILKKLYNAKWSKELVKPGDKVELNVESEGLDNGEAISFLIWQRDIKKADVQTKSIEAKIQGDKAKAEWEIPAGGENSDDKKTDGFSSPGYYFTVICNPDLTARSEMLFIEDFIELELKDDEGNALKNEEYILYLPNGEVRKGKLDGSGYKKEEKVPGGNFSITFPNLSRFKKD